jgi:hypothetical protein
MTGMRRDMTARVVPLGSREAGEPPCPPTVAERLALLTVLSRAAWALARLPLPSYTRATMPVHAAARKAPSAHGRRLPVTPSG